MKMCGGELGMTKLNWQETGEQPIVTSYFPIALKPAIKCQCYLPLTKVCTRPIQMTFCHMFVTWHQMQTRGGGYSRTVCEASRSNSVGLLFDDDMEWAEKRIYVKREIMHKRKILPKRRSSRLLR